MLSNKGVNLIYLILQIKCGVISSAIFVVLLFKLQMNNSKRKRYSKCIIIPPILGILTYIITTSMDITRTCVVIVYDTSVFHFDSKIVENISGMANIFYFVARILLYFSLLYRVYTSFKSSVYKMTNKTIIFYVITTVLYFIIMVMYVVVVYTYSFFGLKALSVLSKVLIIFNVSINVSILGLFIYKLKQILIQSGISHVRDAIDREITTQNFVLSSMDKSVDKSMDKSVDKSDNNNDSYTGNAINSRKANNMKFHIELPSLTTDETSHGSPQEPSVITSNVTFQSDNLPISSPRNSRHQSVAIKKHLKTKRNIYYIDLITKFTILGIFMVFINQIYFLNNVITNWMNISAYTTAILWQLSYYFRCIEGMVNIIVLYLLFGFNKNDYIKCCKHCHHKCRLFCIDTTKNTTKNKIKKSKISIQIK